MCIFAKQKLTEVKSKSLSFYELYIDDECQFEDFCKEVAKDKPRQKTLYSIFSLMECFSCQLLPKKKFRQIKGVGRDDIFEFKKNDIRVYVLMQKPNICVVLGGYKDDQKKDLANIKRLVKTIPDIQQLKDKEL